MYMAHRLSAEWGYFIGHAPSPDAPSIVSRLLDTEYTSKICRLAFPEGKLNSALFQSLLHVVDTSP